ncbi:MAG: hypothetical protein ACOY90_19175 [Candidatus Zhuqueibacterota bacterium]
MTTDNRMLFRHIEKLAGEAPAVAAVRVERGAPRLFLNGEEKYPLLAWSWSLKQAAPFFKQAGIDMLHPVLGLNSVWLSSGEYDWSRFDALFNDLLAIHPGAYFLPRVQLDAPEWWKANHPNEMIVPAVAEGINGKNRYHTPQLNPEGGWHWGIHLNEPSFASDLWRREMEQIFRAFLRHVETSPLRSRIFGYQIASGIYGEWHYFMAEFLPDRSPAMAGKVGYVPDAAARLHTGYGLFRDPRQERDVIEFYRRFHEDVCAGTILHFARICKEETGGRALCGAFYGYQLENVWMQEGGHLAPEKILQCPDLDFIASPYSYQSANQEMPNAGPNDVFDDVGNYLGRSRGIAGDAGYRVLPESLKRHGKLYFAEVDPSTCVQAISNPAPDAALMDYDAMLAGIGGAGYESPAGTLKILARDLGQMFTLGNGGWLFDFGPLLAIRRSWYDSAAVIEKVNQFVQLGKKRAALDLSSVAEIAAVYDAKSLFVTRHWKAEEPFPKGADCMDFFSQWFGDSQARALHRLGAPVDFLYRFDLAPEDVSKYRLFLMVNLFYLTPAEVGQLHALFRNSGATVVWFYAPGFVSHENLDQAQMERLTGFRFRVSDAPEAFILTAKLADDEETLTLDFGTKSKRFPRFSITDEEIEPLGFWAESEEVAFAEKKMQGWTSIYVGTAPLPVAVLRWLVKRSGARLWSTKADIIRATRDAAMIVATEPGKRTVNLPVPMTELSGDNRAIHALDMELGEVKIFTTRSLY